MKHPILKGLAVSGALLALGLAATHLAAGPVPETVSAAPLANPPLPAPAEGGGQSMDYIGTLFVFMLATFVGLDVIRRVSRLLHTPLMSLTNAISAIAVVGSILIAGQQHGGTHWNYINLLGLIAIVASVTNIVSGFLITDRMLKMFKKREGKKP